MKSILFSCLKEISTEPLENTHSFLYFSTAPKSLWGNYSSPSASPTPPPPPPLLLGSLLLTRGSDPQRWPSLLCTSLRPTGIWHLHTVQSFTGQVLSILACSPSVSPWRLHLQQTSINLGVTCSFQSPKGPDSSQVNEQTNSFFWVPQGECTTFLLEFKGRTRKNN